MGEETACLFSSLHFFVFLNDTLKRKSNTLEHLVLSEADKRNMAFFFTTLWKFHFYGSHFSMIPLSSPILE